MKHTNEICKQCGSQKRGLLYDRDLLEDADLARIRICTACKSEYFVYEAINSDVEEIARVDDLFVKCYQQSGLSEEQAITVAKRLFINQLKV